jgi:hypothetical protein
MRWLPIGLLGGHALIHLLGFLRAFRYADLAQLTQPLSRAWGVWWLVAAGLVATTAAMLGAGSRAYWVVGAVALVVAPGRREQPPGGQDLHHSQQDQIRNQHRSTHT